MLEVWSRVLQKEVDDISKRIRLSGELMMTKFDFGIELKDTERFLLVRRHNEAYVARNWRVTPAVIELVEIFHGSGLRWMIRKNHPS